MAGESRVVTLVKGADGLGIAVTTVVVGEMRWPRVSSVRPGSVAEKCGTVVVGDLIAEVNGFCVAGKTHLFVRELLQLAPNSSQVTLKLLEPGMLAGCVWCVCDPKLKPNTPPPSPQLSGYWRGRSPTTPSPVITPPVVQECGSSPKPPPATHLPPTPTR